MSQTVSQKLSQIAVAAREHPEWVFSNLACLMDVDFLKVAAQQVNKAGACGVDGVTAGAYSEKLDENLRQLHTRLREGRYRAPPVKRVWLEKEDGTQRPIGVPAYEDKIVQRAVVMLLEAIYEQDFYDFSYGFRRGRSAHQALSSLRESCMNLGVRWVVDADVSKFFDTVDQGLLMRALRKRVLDSNILRLIGKWLKAGVFDAGQLTYPEMGTPQGGVASPLLANVFMHYVLDDWFVKQLAPRLRGRVYLCRFADDFVVCCQREDDARYVLKWLHARFAQCGLALHPEKTQLVAFGPPRGPRSKGGGTFNFLGFTHYWSRSMRGYWVIKRKTAKGRLSRFVRGLWVWCRDQRHKPLDEQHATLVRKLRGHYGYYGIRGNYRMLEIVLWGAERAWRFWLSRRSHKGGISWGRFRALLTKFPLPTPKIVHAI